MKIVSVNVGCIGFLYREICLGCARRSRDRIIGSPGQTRTADPVINSHLLYQLSYWGMEGSRSDALLLRLLDVCTIAFIGKARSLLAGEGHGQGKAKSGIVMRRHASF